MRPDSLRADEEEVLVRRVTMGLCLVALLTVPMTQLGLGANESWVTMANIGVFAVAFALLGRGRLSTGTVVVGTALILWVVTVASVATTAAGFIAGESDGVGLGTGFLWLAAGLSPPVFLVLPWRRALVGCATGLAGALVLIGVMAGSQVGAVLRHPGVRDVLLATTVVVAATATVAWLAGRSADERLLAQLLWEERARVARKLAASQRRREALFTQTARELRTPMQELAASVEPLRSGEDLDFGGADVRSNLDRVSNVAGNLLRDVVRHIGGLVGEVDEPAPSVVEPEPEVEADRDGPRPLTMALMALAVLLMVGVDAWRVVLLPVDGVVVLHDVAAAANRMLLILFLGAAVLAVQFPGIRGWVLTAVAVLAHPFAIWLFVDGPDRAMLLTLFAPAWRTAMLAAGLLATLAVIIERRVRDRDTFRAGAEDDEQRTAELRRREEAAELAYAEAAHELKNPLSVVQGAARTLAQHGGRIDAEQGEKLRVALVHAVDRLDQRLHAMLEVAGADDEERADRSADRPAAAADVLLDAIAMARVGLGDRPVDVDVRVTGHWTSAPPTDVEHVVENLLTNADKYGEPDGLVQLTAHRAGDDIIVEVVNRGGGLTRADAERIFEPYYRAANADDEITGTGLGLAIVARLVSSWGGRCYCRVGGGQTRVGFTMPVAASVQASTWQELQDQLG